MTEAEIAAIEGDLAWRWGSSSPSEAPVGEAELAAWLAWEEGVARRVHGDGMVLAEAEPATTAALGYRPPRCCAAALAAYWRAP